MIEIFQGSYIRHTNGHVEVLDGSNRFMFSADNEAEAARELKRMDESGCFAEVLKEEMAKVGA